MIGRPLQCLKVNRLDLTVTSITTNPSLSKRVAAEDYIIIQVCLGMITKFKESFDCWQAAGLQFHETPHHYKLATYHQNLRKLNASWSSASHFASSLIEWANIGTLFSPNFKENELSDDSASYPWNLTMYPLGWCTILQYVPTQPLKCFRKVTFAFPLGWWQPNSILTAPMGFHIWKGRICDVYHGMYKYKISTA